MHRAKFDQRTRGTNCSIAANLCSVCLYLTKQTMNIIIRHDEINATLNFLQAMHMGSNFRDFMVLGRNNPSSLDSSSSYTSSWTSS